MNEKAAHILRQADPTNRERIEQQNTDINRDWRLVIDNFETRRDRLAVLAQHWEEFDNKLHAFENQIIRLDERTRHVDPVVRSRRQLEDTKHVIQVITCLFADDNLLINICVQQQYAFALLFNMRGINMQILVLARAR